MSTQNTLPPGFSALEPFVNQWSAPTTSRRDQQRTRSSPEERQAFFNAAAPFLDQALAYLDRKSLSELEGSEKRLLNLMLSLGHVQMAVEVHREMEGKHAAARQAMEITRSVTDLL